MGPATTWVEPDRSLGRRLPSGAARGWSRARDPRQAVGLLAGPCPPRRGPRARPAGAGSGLGAAIAGDPPARRGRGPRAVLRARRRRPADASAGRALPRRATAALPGPLRGAGQRRRQQQLSLEVGLTLLNRLTERYGDKVAGSPGTIAFPNADAIRGAPPEELRALGFSRRKVGYLRGIADAVAAGEVGEAALGQLGRVEATRRLQEIGGIGRWSAEYVLLRGLGQLDVYPGDDVGARHRLRRFFGLGHDPSYEEIADLLRPWEPFAGMLYFHLLLDGLTERGDLPARGRA
ncbi:MAG: DNA-3-methyladenine glycosylase 2 family protein [Actinobacteria bacterium]|nr:DNA-3-methyladenine glycosylase 2 family protein [Actinomycetota bacterium]